MKLILQYLTVHTFFLSGMAYSMQNNVPAWFQQTKMTVRQELIDVVTDMEHTKEILHQLLVPSYKNNQRYAAPVRNQQEILKQQQEKKRKLENNLYTIDHFMAHEGIDLSHTLLLLCYKQLDSLKGFTTILPHISNTLTHIDFSHNTLTYVPGYIFRCPSLSTLNLSYNAIALVTYYSEKEQEDYVIHRNTIVTHLNLAHNVLTHFDFTKQWTATPSLTYLDLSDNPLTSYTWNQTSWKQWQDRGFNYTDNRPIIDIRNTHFTVSTIENLLHCYAQKNRQTNKQALGESMITSSILPAFLASLCTYITGYEPVCVIGLTVSALNALRKTAEMVGYDDNQQDKQVAYAHVIYQ